MVAFARHRSIPDAPARAQQVVLHDLSFYVPASLLRPEEAHFDNGVGRLAATVTASAVGKGTRIERHARAYVDVWASALHDTRIESGTATIVRAAQGWFEELNGEESLSGGALASSRMKLSVKTAETQRSNLDEASRDVADYEWINLLPNLSRPLAVRKEPSKDHLARVDAMKNETFEGALKNFKTLLEEGANGNDQWRDMAAFLDAKPETVPEFAKTIAAADSPAPWKAPAFLALGQARTENGRKALLDIYSREGTSAGDRMRSSLALVTRTDVGVDLARQLGADATRAGGSATEIALAQQAALHVGVLAGTHADDMEIRREARNLVDKLEGNARTPDDFAVLFATVGNNGGRRARTQDPTLERAFRHRDSKAGPRSTAALSAQRGSRADRWLARSRNQP